MKNMPLLAVNAGPNGPVPHDRPEELHALLPRLLATPGPVILMVHGFKYAPGHATECPHRHIFAMVPERHSFKVLSWPAGFGFGQGHAAEGLAIGFGWQARGTVWQAYAEAARAGESLAELVAMIHAVAPGRAVHAVAHSFGARVVLSALPHLPENALSRIILLAGAEFGTRAAAALATPAGRSAEVINVTSRENDFFDFLLECVIPPPRRGDCSLGQTGPVASNVLTLRMDDPDTLTALRRLGFPIASPMARVCHWSAYTRPGVFPLYSSLLRHAPDLQMSFLRSVLPAKAPPQRSRRLIVPALALSLPIGRKPSF